MYLPVVLKCDQVCPVVTLSSKGIPNYYEVRPTVVSGLSCTCFFIFHFLPNHCRRRSIIRFFHLVFYLFFLSSSLAGSCLVPRGHLDSTRLDPPNPMATISASFSVENVGSLPRPLVRSFVGCICHSATPPSSFLPR